MKRSNVIILTSGLSGSSVVSSLLATAGYWTGESTLKKKDYDTHENAELVELNTRILSLAGYEKHYANNVDEIILADIYSKIDSLDERDYIEFIRNCSAYEPWIWKDPRLWITIPYWNRYLDDDVKFVYLDRSLLQRWISVNLRRKIQSPSETSSYRDGVDKVVKQFLKKNNKTAFYLNFDNLILKPERNLKDLGEFLDIELTVDNLKSVYKHPLYSKNRGFPDFLKASGIYVKNRILKM